MNGLTKSQYVRLNVEMLLEVADPGELGRTALHRIDGDGLMPDAERAEVRVAVVQDAAEAVAYLVDPIDLVKEAPGVDLAQASWSAELIDYGVDAEADLQ